jgi:hypothetical protein
MLNDDGFRSGELVGVAAQIISPRKLNPATPKR